MPSLAVAAGVSRLRHPRALVAAALLLGGVTCATDAPVLAQQGVTTRVFHLRETIGIRRTEYPATVTVQIPKGALPDAGHARVMNNSQELPAQFTARASWDDGSVQTLDIDMNASLDPEEDRRYELQFGPAVTPTVKVERNALTVEEQPDAVVVGKLRFAKSGSPLLSSVSYRGEGMGTGANGLTVTDTNGRRLDLSKAQNPSLEVVKNGPLLVVLKFTAAIPLDETTSVPVELLMEMPNSKTWLKTTATVTDRSRRLKDIAIERPYAWSGFPIIWDIGTDSGTYGVFRAATESLTLTQLVGASGATEWKIESGAGAQRRTLERSAGSRSRNANGWGHLQDARAAVAFAFGRFGREAGTYTIAFTGAGQSTFRFAPAAPPSQHQLVLFEHFVATPVAIGAATSPTAMFTPLSVTVER